MNESRCEAYLDLINQLLNCLSGDGATEILKTNLELVDAGLVQMMLQEADYLAHQGDENKAARLRNIASQLGEFVANSEAAATQKVYLNFLMEVLQAVYDSDNNQQVVYPLLAANIQKLDKYFAQVLQNWAIDTLQQLEPNQAQEYAGIIGNFSNLIQQFPLGNKVNNLELAIKGYEIINTVFNREDSPELWAMLQNNLGNAYSERKIESRADNLEKAINYFEQALLVFNHEDSPELWSMTQTNLGTAYDDRLYGKRADNLEKAINCYQQALLIRTSKNAPGQWAITQTNLGTAYQNRIIGERADNLEKAINCYNQALLVFNLNTFAENWAIVHGGLGNVYINRIYGKKVDNLEKAINCYNHALIVRTHDAFPEDWAMLQNNLGTAYLYRELGEKANNLEQAINFYNQALLVFTPGTFPEDWATTQINLGNAYTNYTQGGKLHNREEFTNYLTQSINCYKQALQVLKSDTFPEKCAMTQTNLGASYRNLSVTHIDDKALKFRQLAIKAYTEALQIINRDSLPHNYILTTFNLGIAYQKDNQFQSAYHTFADAVETVESLRDEIVSGDESKQKLAEEWNELYCSVVEVCLQLNKPTEAIEYAERSKTRNLVEQILTRDLKSIVTQEEDLKKLEQLRDEIASGQYEIQNAKAENSTTLAQHLQQLRHQRNELQDKYLQVGSGFQLEQFQQTLNDQIAIVYLYITNTGLERFIITRNSLKHLNVSNLPEKQVLVNWANEYLETYNQNKTEWRNSLASRLSHLSKIINIDEIINCEEIKKCSRLILIPHRFLHLFPLHALPLANGDFLCDRFPDGVGYAPSCQLLLQAQKRQRTDFTHLFAIQNPTEDLPYTDLEVAVITQYFQPVEVLKKAQATLTAINNIPLNNFHCVHFSCHGYFDLIDARKSALILANAPLDTTPTEHNLERYLNVREGETHDLEKCLTLDAIFSLNLEKCRLVTLSACETGLIDFNNDSDEYIGLPSGFLIAGSPAVVSSLWTVSDLSTAFLMIKFYENLQTYNCIALALNHAQQWLRNLTCEEFEAALTQLQPQINQILAQLQLGKRFVLEDAIEEDLKEIRSRKPYPFANPFYWAAFTASGI